MSPPAWSMPHSMRKDCPFEMRVVLLESGQDTGVLEGVVAEDDAVVAGLDEGPDEEVWLPFVLNAGCEDETLELDAEPEVVDALVDEPTTLAPQTSL